MGHYTGIIVKFNETQMDIARGHGRIRYLTARSLNKFDNKTSVLTNTEVDVLGVAGEMAAAKVLGIRPTGLFISRANMKKRYGKPIPDLLDDIEIRTGSKPTHRLFVHKNDPAEWKFVLVRQLKYATFDVVGWDYGHKIKIGKLWNSTIHYPSYHYPSAWLRPIEELREMVKQTGDTK